jgi:hypothetical protein
MARRARHQAARIVLSVAQRHLLGEMTADAIDARYAAIAQPCAACDHSADLICQQHLGDVAQVRAYRELAAALGVEVP